MSRVYHNSLFNRIKPEKQQKILDIATAEFAARGYNAANINVIAEKAGVSVGSLYKYFNTKEGLYLTVVGRGVETLDALLRQVTSSETTLLEKIDPILLSIQDHSRHNPDIINVYNEMTSQGNPELARKLSWEMESVSARYYRQVIGEAKKQGLVRTDLDEGVAAFCLDNLFLTLQFSYGTLYYKERMKIYIDEKAPERDEEIRRQVLQFIARALGIEEPPG